MAEAKIGFGTTPSLTPAGLVPKPYALRLFVTATSNGFAVMPGGLAMTVDPDATVALSAPDGESRDVWVVSDATPPPHTSLWRPTIEAARIERAPQDLPSRAADNLFWLGRYTERADWTMRVLRICLSRLQEDSAPRQELRASRTALEILLSKEDGKVPGEWIATDARLIEQLAHNLMTSADWYYGLPRTLDNIHRVASITRDRLSLEAWRTLNDFYASRRWRADAMPTAMGDSLQLLDDGLRVLAAFHGLTHENMTRNFGWSFLDMGRRLSRAHNLAEVLLGIFGKARSGEDEREACCSLSNWPTASSPIARATGWRHCCRWCSICCWSTKAIRAASPSSSRSWRGTSIRCRNPARAARASRNSALALSLLTSVRLADVTDLAKLEPDGTRTELAEAA